MKMFLLACMSLAAGAQAQDIPQREVPSVVVNAFRKDYKKATDVEWERKGENYEVEFEENRLDHKMLISPDGTLLYHKQELREADLPAPVAAVVASYKGLRLDDADKITEKGKVTFILELKNRREERELQVTPDGKVLNEIRK